MLRGIWPGELSSSLWKRTAGLFSSVQVNTGNELRGSCRANKGLCMRVCLGVSAPISRKKSCWNCWHVKFSVWALFVNFDCGSLCKVHAVDVWVRKQYAKRQL